VCADGTCQEGGREIAKSSYEHIYATLARLWITCMSDNEVRRRDTAQHLPLRDGRGGGGVQEVEGAREGQRRVG
jgi:hypothetical protein